jgi:hypothetical protein
MDIFARSLPGNDSRTSFVPKADRCSVGALISYEYAETMHMQQLELSLSNEMSFADLPTYF